MKMPTLTVEFLHKVKTTKTKQKQITLNTGSHAAGINVV